MNMDSVSPTQVKFEGINNDRTSLLTTTEILRSSEELSNHNKPANKFLMLKMNENVTGFNVSTYFLIQSACSIGITFMNSFLVYIVKDLEYYNVPKADLGRVLGDLTFVAELFIIPSHLILGALMDAVGRKYPTALGLLLAGISISLIP